MSNDTQEILDRLKAVCEAAPAGPYEIYKDDFRDYPCVRVKQDPDAWKSTPICSAEQENGVAEFVVASRTALPALRQIAELAHARRQVDEGHATLYPGRSYDDIVADLNAALDALAPLKDIKPR